MQGARGPVPERAPARSQRAVARTVWARMGRRTTGSVWACAGPRQKNRQKGRQKTGQRENMPGIMAERMSEDTPNQKICQIEGQKGCQKIRQAGGHA